jgi:Tol biopolymer transport system component
MRQAPHRASAIVAAAACALLVGCGGEPGVGDEPQAYKVDVATGELTKLSDGEGAVTDLAWSPDGEELAYATSGRILVRTDGGGRRPILDDSASSQLQIDWSPGGGSIAFASIANEDMERVGFVSTDGEVTRVLESFRNPGALERPEWSPDGTRIAYSRPLGPFRLTPGSTKAPPAPQVDARPLRVFVVAASSGEPHVVPTGGLTSAPQWSPDGRGLLLTQGDRLVFRSTTDSTGTRTLVKPPYAPLRATWAPNGHQIAVASVGPDDRRLHVYVVSRDGGKPRLLVPSEIESGPAWSPESGRIAYSDYDGQIWVVRVRDASPRRVVLLENAEIHGLAWSPRGDAIAFIGLKRPPGD